MQRADDTGRHRARVAEWTSDRDHRLSHVQLGRVAQGRRRKRSAGHADHGDVVELVGPDQRRDEGVSVGHDHVEVGRPRDDVVVGHQVADTAGVRDHEAAAQARRAAATGARDDRPHRRDEQLRDSFGVSRRRVDRGVVDVDGHGSTGGGRSGGSERGGSSDDQARDQHQHAAAPRASGAGLGRRVRHRWRGRFRDRHLRVAPPRLLGWLWRRKAVAH